jgi:DNA transformation protein and related proteins
MPVSADFRAYVLEQMERVLPVSARSMFGGVGIYSGGLFFALIADDVVYLKVDDTNRHDFERAGMGPFQPYGPGTAPMGYYELPGDHLEQPDALRPWLEKSLAVASARRKKR